MNPSARMDADLRELMQAIPNPAPRAIRHWCRERGRRCTPENLAAAHDEMLWELERRGWKIGAES